MQPQKSSYLILILLFFYQKLKVQKLIQAAFELFQTALGNCLTYRPGPHQTWSSPATPTQQIQTHLLQQMIRVFA